MAASRGKLPPKVTPGSFVDRVAEVPDPISERAAIQRGDTYP